MPKPIRTENGDAFVSGWQASTSMMEAFLWMIATLGSALRDRRELALENLALRQQLAILARAQRRCRLRKMDRLFWVWLSRMWKSRQELLIVVKPDTVVRWHRKGFALYWTRLSRQMRAGRPGTGKEVRKLICKMAGANPLWGSPRVHGELLKFGTHIYETRRFPYKTRYVMRMVEMTEKIAPPGIFSVPPDYAQLDHLEMSDLR